MKFKLILYFLIYSYFVFILSHIQVCSRFILHSVQRSLMTVLSGIYMKCQGLNLNQSYAKHSPVHCIISLYYLYRPILNISLDRFLFSGWWSFCFLVLGISAKLRSYSVFHTKESLLVRSGSQWSPYLILYRC